MIPEYPIFKRLELQDQPFIYAMTKHFLPISDFNFASLYSYNLNNNFEISILDQNLVLKLEDYLSGDPFHTLIGKNNVHSTLMTLANTLGVKEPDPFLKLIPEVVLKNNRRQLTVDFHIEPDPNNFDYIISVNKLITLSGRKYATKRQKINQFKNNYPKSLVKQINLEDELSKKQILDVFMDWSRNKATSESESAREYTALLRYFDINKYINSMNFGLYSDNRLIAFTFNEIVQSKYYIGHFGKALYEYVGAFQYIEHITAVELHKYGCIYMNFEQDLGISGLKESKLSWHPVRYFKKFNIYKKM